MKKLLFVIVFIYIPLLLKAQYDAQFSNYWAVQSYYNPAAAGHSSQIEATAFYKQQWLGIDGAPQSFVVTGSVPLKFLGRTHGVGVSFFSESIGLFKHNVMSVQYAYKKSLWGGLMSAGLQAGSISETFDGANVYIPQSEYHQSQDDAILTSEGSGSAIDFSFGLFYSHKKWYAGLSASHLLEPEIELGENSYIYPVRAYYLTGGYNIELNNPLLELQSSVLYKSTIQMNTVDINLRLCYNKMLWGGLGWRPGDAVTVALGAKLKKIQMGYAYDYPISFMSKGTSGSHELFLKYTTDLTLGKGNKNKHKSVRIL